MDPASKGAGHEGRQELESGCVLEMWEPRREGRASLPGSALAVLVSYVPSVSVQKIAMVSSSAGNKWDWKGEFFCWT